jgi:hypothetical protein
MAPVTLEALKAKITRVEKEITEVRQGLEELLASTAGPTRQETPPNQIQAVNKDRWLQLVDEWFQQLGVAAPSIGAEKLQALMLQEGLKPEDNLLSQGIIAMREE